MTLSQIMEYIMLLPAPEKQVILEMLMQEAGEKIEGDYHAPNLFRSDGWKEISKRAEEVIKEKKTCLIHFDDHIQLLN